MSTKYKLEYIWLDGYTPEPNLRSKTKIVTLSKPPTLKDCPEWGFDGSSTQQAEGRSSDCLLKAVRLAPDADRANAYLVLCEVLNADGTPHATNARATFEDDPDLWLGYEQEYVLTMDGKPLGFPTDGYPGPQGPYYCGVGTGKVAGREIVEEHLDLCLNAGLEVTGINAEVLLGQWEYQIFGKGAKEAADSVQLTRYLLIRTAEKYGVTVELHPKPIKGDWNGSGMHTNFSTTRIREKGGEKYVMALMEQFKASHKEHIAVYGSSNELRLTGKHETQSIKKFSFGASDRGASIRIPVGMIRDNWKGYLEDRRPASNADPYKVAARLIETLKQVK
ncbi:MAG: glutamine synthetase beta-grasp domain-containing protein [Rhodothermales bacterium]|nr:glutamine synthetase beta-grasp domain-containing protein [Rhodothermales bacterium]